MWAATLFSQGGYYNLSPLLKDRVSLCTPFPEHLFPVVPMVSSMVPHASQREVEVALGTPEPAAVMRGSVPSMQL